jgi:hypothetical protein
MPIRLNDEHCLLWIKDPSISPFENDNNYVARKYRKDILIDQYANPDNVLENPQSFLSKIRRKCFYNTTLRQKIVEQIKEYQRNKTLRLYILNDIVADLMFSDIKYYTTDPFKPKECMLWAKNHLINPRTNTEIPMTGSVYIELIYTTIQYGLPLPPILNEESTEKDNIFNKIAKKIAKNVMIRQEFINQNDELFLNHDTESFDRRLNILSPTTPKHREAAKAARQEAKPTNSHGISLSSSYKSLNSVERRQLRDMELENREEKSEVAKYKYKKGLVRPKKDIDKTVFAAFREFLEDLQSSVNDNNELINNILKDATVNAKALITVPIISYLQNKTLPNNFLKDNNLDTIEGIISNFINNIYAQLLDPSFFLTPYMKIACFSFNNKNTYYNNAELIKKITNELFDFIDNKYEFGSSDKTPKYFRSIVVDVILSEYVAKRVLDIRSITGTRTSISNYQNFYYKLLLKTNDEPKRIRLPEGRGLLIGKELTKAIYDLDEVYFNQSPEDRVITDDNPLNGFTYEECKDWVIMPIINPRTFKSILIDSPMYNRLLCMSYQYDTNLIPRMITSRGYEIIQALTEVIEIILRDEGKLPQSREQLEQYIIGKEAQFAVEKENNIVPNKVGLKWKNVGVKEPKSGVEINNKKLIEAFLKYKEPIDGMPFYVLFSQVELANVGIINITKRSYINIATYYIPDIDRNTSRARSTNRIGLKWKKVDSRQHIGRIEKEGVKINSKKLTATFLKLKDINNIYPLSVLFSESELAKKFNITAVAKNNYIKISNYYVPVIEKKESVKYKKPKTNSKVVNKIRTERFIPDNYYTVADCLRWTRQPNRDPKDPNILFSTDSKEYNVIFEQALLYDYNMLPINITSKGIKFRKAILKISKKYLAIANHLKRPISKGLDIAKINSKICNAIKEIFDDKEDEEGKKYKRFKDKMIEKCEQFNKPSSICIAELKVSIDAYFKPGDTHKKVYEFHYYQESALASLLIEYESIKNHIYKEEYRDIFIHDFNKFKIFTFEIDDNLDEHLKAAIDAGGPKREFFTKLFGELFCDDKNNTRPFICPKDIIGNKYYINPNFEPDNKFRKVIDAYRKNYASITEFKTEKDYEYIYYVIGKLLCLPVYNEEIGLPQQLSIYILAGLINQPIELDYYDLLYIYLKEFHNGVYYIKMISKQDIKDIESVYMSFNDTYNISRTKGTSSDGVHGADGAKINKKNCIKFLLQQAKHAVTKNFITKDDGNINSTKSMKIRYDSLFAGFSNEIRKFLYKKGVSVDQLSSLITNETLTYAILQEFVDKLIVKIEVFYLSESDPEYDINDRMTEVEKTTRVNEMRLYISNIITIKRRGVEDKEHIEFVKKLLQFWSGLNYYNRNKDYKIFYKFGVGINVKKLPESHTCYNILDIYGFPEDTNVLRIEDREDYIYKKIKIAIGEENMELQ